MRSTTQVKLVLALLLCQGSLLLAEESDGVSLFASFFFQGRMNGDQNQFRAGDLKPTVGNSAATATTEPPPTEQTTTTEPPTTIQITTTEPTTTTVPTTLAPVQFNGVWVRRFQVADLSSLLENSVSEPSLKKDEGECYSKCIEDYNNYGSFAMVGDVCICSNYWRNDSSLVGPKPKSDGNNTIIYMKNIQIGAEDCLLPTGSVLSEKLGRRRSYKSYWLSELPGYEENDSNKCIAMQYFCNNGILNATRLEYKREGEDHCMQVFSTRPHGGPPNYDCHPYMGSYSYYSPPNFSEFEATVKLLQDLKPDGPVMLGCNYGNKRVSCHPMEFFCPKQYTNLENRFEFNGSDIKWAEGHPKDRGIPVYFTQSGFMNTFDQSQARMIVCRAKYPTNYRSRKSIEECTKENLANIR